MAEADRTSQPTNQWRHIMSRHTEYGNSPVGRLISGDPWTKQTTDANNRPIPPEKQSFWFAVAIEKNAPGMNEMLGLMFKAAQAGYGQAPQIMAQINPASLPVLPTPRPASRNCAGSTGRDAGLSSFRPRC